MLVATLVADTGLDSLVGTATTLCAKKETVPASCTITDVNNYATDHECYNYYDIGGAMQWADHVNLPDVNNMQVRHCEERSDELGIR